MITNKIWSSVYENTKSLLNSLWIADGDSDNVLYNNIEESKMNEDLSKNPTSIFNGAYVLHFNGITNAQTRIQDINGTYAYGVRLSLQVAFLINENDEERNSLHEAINDCETIIVKRMNPTSYSGTFEGITMDGLPTFESATTTNSETYLIATINFIFTNRIYY